MSNEADLPEKSFYTIGEVADMLGINQSQIRFWEKSFKQLKPLTSKNGHRRYGIEQIKLLRYILYLTKEKGMTLEGANQALKHTESNNHERMELQSSLIELRDFLQQMREAIKLRLKEKGSQS